MKSANRKSDFSRTKKRLLIKGAIMAILLPALCWPAGAKDAEDFYPTKKSTQRYSYYRHLPKFKPDTPLEANEMRIIFMGSSIPPTRKAQNMMSIYVEVGDAKGAGDHFVFDCGSGVCANYAAMGIGFEKMNKVFLTHIHGDHISDLTHIYCFGPPARQTPLFVFGPGPSNKVYTEPYDPVYNPEPKTIGPFDDGTTVFCQMFRAAMRWHSESFSFQYTRNSDYDPSIIKDLWNLRVDPVPVRDPRASYPGGERYNQADYIDDPNDAYALIPIELDWTKYGAGYREGSETVRDNVAYENSLSGVKITHFPVIHARQASIGFKLEWNGLSMIYTGDTKPETHSIDQANNNGKGVDVFIHEMIVPPQVWAMKIAGQKTTPPFNGPGVQQVKQVQDSSHTPQGAYGYILSQISKRPRLAVACHFPAADDTVHCALESVQEHCPDIKKIGKELVWDFDLLVLRVTQDEIKQCRGIVNDFGFGAATPSYTNQITPRYWTWQLDDKGEIVLDGNNDPVKVGDPFGQIDDATAIPATNPDGSTNYREDGY